MLSSLKFPCQLVTHHLVRGNGVIDTFIIDAPSERLTLLESFEKYLLDWQIFLSKNKTRIEAEGRQGLRSQMLRMYKVVQDANGKEIYVTVTDNSIVVDHSMPKQLLLDKISLVHKQIE